MTPAPSPNEQAAIAHKHAIEQYTTGAGKDGVEARALDWIENRQALGKIGEKTAVGYRREDPRHGRG